MARSTDCSGRPIFAGSYCSWACSDCQGPGHAAVSAASAAVPDPYQTVPADITSGIELMQPTYDDYVLLDKQGQFDLERFLLSDTVPEHPDLSFIDFSQPPEDDSWKEGEVGAYLQQLITGTSAQSLPSVPVDPPLARPASKSGTPPRAAFVSHEQPLVGSDALKATTANSRKRKRGDTEGQEKLVWLSSQELEELVQAGRDQARLWRPNAFMNIAPKLDWDNAPPACYAAMNEISLLTKPQTPLKRASADEMASASKRRKLTGGGAQQNPPDASWILPGPGLRPQALQPTPCTFYDICGCSIGTSDALGSQPRSFHPLDDSGTFAITKRQTNCCPKCRWDPFHRPVKCFWQTRRWRDCGCRGDCPRKCRDHLEKGMCMNAKVEKASYDQRHDPGNGEIGSCESCCEDRCYKTFTKHQCGFVSETRVKRCKAHRGRPRDEYCKRTHMRLYRNSSWAPCASCSLAISRGLPPKGKHPFGRGSSGRAPHNDTAYSLETALSNGFVGEDARTTQ